MVLEWTNIPMTLDMTHLGAGPTLVGGHAQVLAIVQNLQLNRQTFGLDAIVGQQAVWPRILRGIEVAGQNDWQRLASSCVHGHSVQLGNQHL